MDKQITAENIKLIVTVNGEEHALELRDVDLGSHRQDFVNHADALGEQMALLLQKDGIVPYTDFAVVDDRNGLHSVGVPAKKKQSVLLACWYLLPFTHKHLGTERTQSGKAFICEKCRGPFGYQQ